MEAFREQSAEEKARYEQAVKEYKEFLVHVWSPKLRDLGLIPPHETINLHCLNENRNNMLLEKLRLVNYSVYEDMADKFLILKSTIVLNGGAFTCDD